MSRRAARVDSNHGAIKAAFAQLGCWTLDLSRVGSGCPDLLVMSQATKRMLLVEVKDGEKVPSAQALTPDQVRFHREWQGAVRIVTSIDDAAKVVAELRTGYLNGQPT